MTKQEELVLLLDEQMSRGEFYFEKILIDGYSLSYIYELTRRRFILPNKRLGYMILITNDKIILKSGMNRLETTFWNVIPFERFYEVMPENIKEILLYNMDLFING